MGVVVVGTLACVVPREGSCDTIPWWSVDDEHVNGRGGLIVVRSVGVRPEVDIGFVSPVEIEVTRQVDRCRIVSPSVSATTGVVA